MASDMQNPMMNKPTHISLDLNEYDSMRDELKALRKLDENVRRLIVQKKEDFEILKRKCISQYLIDEVIKELKKLESLYE